MLIEASQQDITHNTKIDAIKVLQKRNKCFIISKIIYYIIKK